MWLDGDLTTDCDVDVGNCIDDVDDDGDTDAWGNDDDDDDDGVDFNDGGADIAFEDVATVVVAVSGDGSDRVGCVGDGCGGVCGDTYSVWSNVVDNAWICARV